MACVYFQIGNYFSFQSVSNDGWGPGLEVVTFTSIPRMDQCADTTIAIKSLTRNLTKVDER